MIMNTQRRTLLAIALAMTVGAAYGQSGGDGGAGGGGRTATAPTFQDWLNKHSSANNGRVSRKAYMDEVGRRWDSVDHNRQGLSTSQINDMYGGTSGGSSSGAGYTTGGNSGVTGGSSGTSGRAGTTR